MRTLLCCIFALVLLESTAFVPSARADEWNQMTKLTFNHSVEIPGGVLPAGTYWFKMLDSSSNRHIVQIFSNDWTKIDATVITADAWRYHTTSRTDLEFAERRHDKPEALLTWFYPGMDIGHEFLYPAKLEARLDHDTKQDVLMPRSESGSSAPTVMLPRGE